MIGQQKAESYPTVRTIVFLVALAVLLGQIGQILLGEAGQAGAALRLPFALNYVEGITLDQQQRPSLEALYPQHLTPAPFAVTSSPPLYYLLTRALGAAAGVPSFVPGRAVSIAATLAAALLTGLICLGLSRKAVGALAAGVMVLMFPAVSYWGLFNTPEPLAFAFGLASLCALVWFDNATGVTLAGVFIVAAAATGGSLALTPWLTAVVWLLLQRRWRAVIGLGLAVPACWTAGVLVLNTITGGGFVLNVITAGDRGYSGLQMLGYMFNLLVRVIPLLVICLAYFLVERLNELERPPGSDRALVFLLTAFGAGALSGFIGTNMSATLMPAAAICVAMGVALGWLSQFRLVAAGVLVALFVQLTPLEEWRAFEFTPEIQRKLNGVSEASQLAKMFHDAGGAVLTDEYISTLVMQGQRPYIYPLEFNQLQTAGKWSDADLVSAIRTKHFKLIALYEPATGDGLPLVIQRWPRPVIDAISEAYKPNGTLADAEIFVP